MGYHEALKQTMIKKGEQEQDVLIKTNEVVRSVHLERGSLRL